MSTDITTNPKVCGLYGDASGNSTWDWAVEGTNPDYCTYWYARTNSTSSLLTPMGSPFVNATTGKLSVIADAKDYTRDKGWELLRRDFGCSHVTSYPYFVLYNRYSGLMRIYIYQNESQPYSSMSVKIQPVTAPYPGITAAADSIQAAPDKYLSTSSSSTIGKTVIAVSDNLGGSNRWTLVEFDPIFDPNIANAIYTGSALQFTIYGVQSYDLQATINGTTISGSSPGLNFTPSAPPTNSNGQTIFTAAEGKFTTFSKDLNDLKSGINNAAKGISDYLAYIDADPKSVEGEIKSKADDAKDKTSSISSFANALGDVASIFTGGANVLKLAGTLIGLFTGGSSKKTPAAAPVYTSVNLSLHGSLTLQDVAETFILRVPGTIQTNGNNATYYQCPLGIFNLVNTPTADTVMYNRYIEKGALANTQMTFVNYRIKDDIPVSYFDGAGLDLVSVQGAIMGKVQLGSDGKKASYNPFAPATEAELYSDPTHIFDNTVNYMRPDFDAGRLEITFYDTSSAHLHLFQTPFVNLECMKGQSMQVPKTTTVFLRVKAILKRKDDPDNIPILYIQDYRIDPVQGTLDPTYRAQLLDANPSSQIITTANIVNPPYASYTEKPLWLSERILQNLTYNSASTLKGDHSLTAGPSVTIASSAQGVVFEAGSIVYLEPGFTAQAGCVFTAVINNYGAPALTCSALQKQAYQSTTGCYNITATGLAQKPSVNTTSPNRFIDTDSSAALTFYPNPAHESLTISGLGGWGRSTIAVYDQTGRKLFTVNKLDESPTLQLNLADLTSGVYFLEILGDTKKLTHKFIVAR